MHFNPCFCRDILHQTFHGTFAHTLGTHIFVANVFSIKYFDHALDMLKCESLLPEMEKIEHKDPLRVLFLQTLALPHHRSGMAPGAGSPTRIMRTKATSCQVLSDFALSARRARRPFSLGSHPSCHPGLCFICHPGLRPGISFSLGSPYRASPPRFAASRPNAS